MLGGTLLHAARRVHREQEIIQRAHAFGRGLLALQPLTQRGKRCDGAGTQLVELVQLRLCGLIDRNAVAVRMLDPVALPRRTMYLPGDRVVLEPVDLVPRKPGQTGLEAAEQLPSAPMTSAIGGRDSRSGLSARNIGISYRPIAMASEALYGPMSRAAMTKSR